MKKVLPLFLVAVICCLSQVISAQEVKYVKIDSLGYHLAINVVDVPGKTSTEIYEGVINYINQNFKNPEEVLKASTENKYTRFRYFDPLIASLKRTGVSLTIGGFTEIELDFKDDKMRIKSITPELYVNADDVSNRLPFLVTGGMMTNSLYSKKLKPKKEMVKHKVKEQLESYYSTLVYKLVNIQSDAKKDEDW